MYNDTSGAEVFHDTSWAELFHDTSWFVNFSGNFLGNAENHGDPDYKADNVSSTPRPFGRIIKFVLATTALSGRPQFTRQQQSIRNWIEDLINSIFTEFWSVSSQRGEDVTSREEVRATSFIVWSSKPKHQ